MKIEFCCSAYCVDEGEPTQLSGCGIVLRYIDEGKRCKRRELGFALGNSDLQLAQIQSVRLALSSIKPGNRKFKSIAYVDDDYVIDVIRFGSVEYKHASGELRKWFDFYTDLRVVHEDDARITDEARFIAVKATESQEHYDSGSINE